jgi:hypothetical protein
MPVVILVRIPLVLFWIISHPILVAMPLLEPLVRMYPIHVVMIVVQQVEVVEHRMVPRRSVIHSSLIYSVRYQKNLK